MTDRNQPATFRDWFKVCKIAGNTWAFARIELYLFAFGGAIGFGFVACGYPAELVLAQALPICKFVGEVIAFLYLSMLSVSYIDWRFNGQKPRH